MKPMTKPDRCAYVQCQRTATSRSKFCSRRCAATVRVLGPKAARANLRAVQSKNRMDRGVEGGTTLEARSHIEGAHWVSVTNARPLSDLERRALALWAPPECIDKMPGRRAAIRNAVALELGNTVIADDAQDEAGPLRCPAHMIGETAA